MIHNIINQQFLILYFEYKLVRQMGQKMSTPPDSIEMTSDDSDDDNDAKAAETVDFHVLKRTVVRWASSVLGRKRDSATS